MYFEKGLSNEKNITYDEVDQAINKYGMDDNIEYITYQEKLKPMNCRIIVAGTREFDDFYQLKDVVSKAIQDIDQSIYNIEIVSGCARGADNYGEIYANQNKINLTRIRPLWNMYGRKAGPIRNAQMAKYAKDGDMAILIAFWDGKSVGTKNMIDIAKHAKFDRVIVSKYKKLT